MTAWILVDIGCLECGEDSKAIGIFKSRAEAEAAWKEYAQRDSDNRWGRLEWTGEHAGHIEQIELEVKP